MIIGAASAVIGSELVGPHWVEVTNQLITNLGTGIHPAADKLVTGTLIPGFIDIHCHGGGGHYFYSDDSQSISKVIQTHRAKGTTGLIASLVTAPINELKSQISRLVPFYEKSEILGIHLEGPFLAKGRCGAHDPSLRSCQ